MRLKILRRMSGQVANKACADYVCQDEEGQEHNVDIFVDGGIPSEIAAHIKDEDLIGKTIEVGWLSAYLSIANDVRWPPVA